MQELGRVKVKVNLGVGLNLLCVAGASYVAVKALTKMVECNNAIRSRDAINAINDFVKNCDETLEKLKPGTEVSDDAEEEKTEESI